MSKSRTPRLTLKILHVLESCVEYAQAADALDEDGDLEGIDARDVDAAERWLEAQRRALESAKDDRGASS